MQKKIILIFFMVLQSTAAFVDGNDGAKSIKDIFGDRMISVRIAKKLGKKSVNEVVTQAELNTLDSLCQTWRKTPKSIFDISALQCLSNLTTLWLVNGRISDLRPLSELTNLRYLHLINDKIVDIEPLSNLKNLECLYLPENRISDLTPLHKLTKLKILNITSNRIRDISPLGSLVNLRELSLIDNPITSLSSLKYLDGLILPVFDILHYHDKVRRDLPMLVPGNNKGKSRRFIDWIYDKIYVRFKMMFK